MLSLALSHLREHKFKYSFDDTLNALVGGLDVETALFFSLSLFEFLLDDVLS